MANAKRFYEEVTEGEELSSFEISISRTHIIKYVGAGGDFQQIHHDEEYAKSIGLPSVFANGLMHGGMLARVVTDWAGDAVIKQYRLRFKTIVWPNDTLTFKGQVLKKYKEAENHLVDCSLSVVNQKGESAIEGEATVSLPVKR
jgi:acyl dehydratase